MNTRKQMFIIQGASLSGCRDVQRTVFALNRTNNIVETHCRLCPCIISRFQGIPPLISNTGASYVSISTVIHGRQRQRDFRL